MLPSSSDSSGSEDSERGRGQKRSSNKEALDDKVLEKSPKGRFYRFNRKLGTGAYKTVYLAFDNDTGREVAWNVISFAHLSRSERKRIDGEIQIAKSLDHPRILRFVSAWINKEKEEVVFITERITGGSLRAYIGRLDGPLKLKVIKNWCKQLLEGISYLHGQPNPVIHRDLKCDNIFVNGNDGKVIIGDLGLSTSLHGGASCATSIVGTPEFMAPELYEEKYGPPVDIYAFGMCLLEMVSRKYPYSECTTPGQIYKKVINNERPKSLSQIKDDALRHIIEVCLDTDPGNRPTASELLADPYWGQSDDGDRLAEIIEEPEEPEKSDHEQPSSDIPDNVSDQPKPSPVPPARSTVYHEEAEKRKQQAAAAAAAAATRPNLPMELPPNVLLGPTDDTLIFLSSPKSNNRGDHPQFDDDLETSDVLTYCRRHKIDRVEKVHLILEIEEGKFHNVIFDFNPLTDHPQIISQELRDAGLVWSGVSSEDLVVSLAKSIMDRIAELSSITMTTSEAGGAQAAPQDIGSLNSPFANDSGTGGGLTSAGAEGSSSTNLTSTPHGSSIDLLSGDSPKTNITAPPPPPTEATSLASSDPAQVTGGSAGVGNGGKPPLAPRGSNSVDSVTSSPNVSNISGGMKKNNSYYGLMDNVDASPSTYMKLSRETCSHLTTPCGQVLPTGEYAQPPRLTSFDTNLPTGGMVSPDATTGSILLSANAAARRHGSVSGMSEPENATTGGQRTSIPSNPPPRRQASMGSFDEHLASTTSSGGVVGFLNISLQNWPCGTPPINTPGRQIISDDLKQLQAMLAVVSTGERGRHTNFVPGVYCAFTEDTVRDFQMHSGLDITGEVDDKTWETLLEQVAYKKKKEEERAHKREEAQRKAKIEQEKRLQQQKEESARAMDNMLEKTLSLIGSSNPSSSATAGAASSKKQQSSGTIIFPSVSPLPPASPTGTSTGVTTTTHPSPGMTSVSQPPKSGPRISPRMQPAMVPNTSLAPPVANLLDGPDSVVVGIAPTTHSPPAVMSPKSMNGRQAAGGGGQAQVAGHSITSPRSRK